MTSTSSGPTINLSEDDEVTVVTRWDAVLHKKLSYRTAITVYLIAGGRAHLPLPSCVSGSR